MTRHKHYSEIIAWAEGAEIEGRGDSDKEWVSDINPGWFIDCQYRIKPKTVKREGWVNIYRASPESLVPRNSGGVHKTEEIAKSFAGDGCVATLRVEWEETK